jgi:hypothetical protein
VEEQVVLLDEDRIVARQRLGREIPTGPEELIPVRAMSIHQRCRRRRSQFM